MGHAEAMEASKIETRNKMMRMVNEATTRMANDRSCAFLFGRGDREDDPFIPSFPRTMNPTHADAKALHLATLNSMTSEERGM